MKAVILAGGLGTRLQPYTKSLPKPMLPLGGRPILEHLIDWVKKNGVTEIVLCVSYKRKKIENYFKDGKKFGVKIEYAISNKPLATAGQLKTAEKFIDDTFVCLYGDSIYNFSLRNMIRKHNRKKSTVTMSLFKYRFNLKYGVINTVTPTYTSFNSSGKVLSWKEKPEFNVKINMGCYVMEPEIFRLIPRNKSYGMDNVIRKVISKKKLVSSILSQNEFIDIGDKETYEKAKREFRKK
jgi:mannose-1-phosphate guanylyltransferase